MFLLTHMRFKIASSISVKVACSSASIFVKYIKFIQQILFNLDYLFLLKEAKLTVLKPCTVINLHNRLLVCILSILFYYSLSKSKEMSFRKTTIGGTYLLFFKDIIDVYLRFYVVSSKIKY